MNQATETFLEKHVNDTCVSHAAMETEKKQEFLVTIATNMIPISVFVGAVVSLVAVIKRRRRRGSELDASAPLLGGAPRATALFLQNEVPTPIVVVVGPLFGLVLGSLVVAHTAVLAQAEGILSVDGSPVQTLIVENLTNYGTINQFRQAGVYIFYLLVLVGAVIIPYAQLLGICALWLVPLRQSWVRLTTTTTTKNK